MLVIRCDDIFLTTIYKKPSCTGVYVQWERFSAKKQKLALIYSLVTRANRIYFALSLCYRMNKLSLHYMTYLHILLVMDILIVSLTDI